MADQTCHPYQEDRRIPEMRGFDMTQAEFAERIGISQNYRATMGHGKVDIGAYFGSVGSL
jgi:predicted transcriptional regulator